MQFEGRANKATLGQQLCLGKSNGAGAAERIEQKLQLLEQVIYQLGEKRLNDLKLAIVIMENKAPLAYPSCGAAI